MYWNAGDPFRPKIPLTVLLKNTGINENARGWITFVDAKGISFYLDRGTPGAGWIEARTEPGIFGANFVPDSFGSKNHAYARSKHYLKLFP